MLSISASLSVLFLVAVAVCLAPLLVYVTRAHPLLLNRCMRRFQLSLPSCMGRIVE